MKCVCTRSVKGSVLLMEIMSQNTSRDIPKNTGMLCNTDTRHRNQKKAFFLRAHCRHSKSILFGTAIDCEKDHFVIEIHVHLAS